MVNVAKYTMHGSYGNALFPSPPQKKDPTVGWPLRRESSGDLPVVTCELDPCNALLARATLRSCLLKSLKKVRR